MATPSYVKWKPIGIEGVVRRIPKDLRDTIYDRFLIAGAILLRQYRTASIRPYHYRTGTLYRSIRMKRNKRKISVTVGVHADRSIKEPGRPKGPRSSEKARFLEFGTKQGVKEHLYLITYRRFLRANLDKDMIARYNAVIDNILGGVRHTANVKVIKAGLKI